MAFHSSLKTSPFRVVYGRDPPLRSYVHGEAQLLAVHHQLQDRDEFLQEIRERLEQAQAHYKFQYDRNHQELEFAVGEWAWLRLLHCPIASLQVASRGKLSPKFYGPFLVLKRVGLVAYKLQLPKGAKLHDVFHVGLLKYHGLTPEGPGILLPIRHGRACLEPVEVTWNVVVARGREEVLVHRNGPAAADAMWVALDEFHATYPTFQLTDELILQVGRDVMYRNTYQRRRKQQDAGANENVWVTTEPSRTKSARVLKE
jgi:hypothetical protein